MDSFNEATDIVECLKKRDARIIVSLNVLEVLAIIGTLNLGLKHEENNGFMLDIVGDVIDLFTSQLASQMTEREKSVFASFANELSQTKE